MSTAGGTTKLAIKLATKTRREAPGESKPARGAGQFRKLDIVTHNVVPIK